VLLGGGSASFLVQNIGVTRANAGKETSMEWQTERIPPQMHRDGNAANTTFFFSPVVTCICASHRFSVLLLSCRGKVSVESNSRGERDRIRLNEQVRGNKMCRDRGQKMNG